MPSLWKKYKGNRIPRLVDDGDLTVEAGCPTSIVDLFVKNRDRLKKTSKKKKKYRLKHPSIKEPTPDEQQSSSSSSPVSDPYVSFYSKLDVPSWSNDEKTQQTVKQKNNYDFYVEQTVTKKNRPNVESSHDYCCIGDGDEANEENGGVFTQKHVIWWSVVKGALVVLVALYTKRIVVGIIIGALLLILLEYVGSLVFRLFTTCEESKRKLQDYSEWRLTVGEEGDGDKVLKGLVQSALRVSSKRAKEGENVVTPKRVIEQEIGTTDVSKCGAFTSKDIPSRKIVAEQEVGNIVVLKSATLNGIASKKIIEQEDGSNNVVVKSATLKGFGITSKKLIEQEDGSGIPPRGEFEITTLNSCSGKDVSNKSGGEIEVLEQNFCAGPKNSTCCVPGGYCELGWRKEAIEGGGGGNEGESFEMANKKKSKKKKRGKKFWKKFVARHIRKKRKHKLDTELHQPGLAHKLPSLEEITSALEYEDDPEEMVDGEGSSSSSSEDDDDDSEEEEEEEEEEWLGRAEHFSIANQNCTKMLKTSTYESVKSNENFEERGWNLKCITLMGIALAGLVIGRIFALMLTLVSCVMFKMLRI